MADDEKTASIEEKKTLAEVTQRLPWVMLVEKKPCRHLLKNNLDEVGQK